MTQVLPSSRQTLLAATIAIQTLVTGGCTGTSDDAHGLRPGTPTIAIANERHPMSGVVSGGQPTPEQIELAASAGIQTVINLRTATESGFEWERDAVQRSGMRYVQLPISSADGLTRPNVDRLHMALAKALERGPVLLHCGSGNRVGAMLALRAHWHEGASPDEALDRGFESGLTGLAPIVREQLGLPPESPTS